MTDHRTATFDLACAKTATVRCVSCADKTCDALSEIDGVLRVECRSDAGFVTVEFDADRITEPELVSAMESYGARLSEEVVHAVWRITGLD